MLETAMANMAKRLLAVEQNSGELSAKKIAPKILVPQEGLNQALLEAFKEY